jgi:hypothetical protein
MSIFDLLFLVLFVATVVALGAAAVAATRGRSPSAVRILRGFALAAVAYFGVLCIVSLASAQPVARIGDERCSDDWCIAVTGAQRRFAASGVTYEVTFRISSRAGRVTQRELGVVAYLLDGRGRRYDAEVRALDVPFDVKLDPMQQVIALRAFVVPTGLADVGAVISHEGVPFPRCCIIGDEGSLFHKKTIVRLD